MIRTRAFAPMYAQIQEQFFRTVGKKRRSALQSVIRRSGMREIQATIWQPRQRPRRWSSALVVVLQVVTGD